MPPTSDPFIDLVEAARRRLDEREGRRISVRELARRAGIPQNTLNYNLDRKRVPGRRQIRPELVRKLAAVLGIPEADLMRAAYASSGYDVSEDIEEYAELRGGMVSYLEGDLSLQRQMAIVADLQELAAGLVRKIVEQESETRSAHPVYH